MINVHRSDCSIKCTELLMYLNMRRYFTGVNGGKKKITHHHSTLHFLNPQDGLRERRDEDRISERCRLREAVWHFDSSSLNQSLFFCHLSTLKHPLDIFNHLWILLSLNHFAATWMRLPTCLSSLHYLLLLFLSINRPYKLQTVYIYNIWA